MNIAKHVKEYTRQLFSLIVLAFWCLFMCACNEETYDYATEKYSVTNNLGESYLIEYSEKAGVPDHSVDIQISINNEVIADYTTQYKREYLPKEIVYLFEDSSNQYYYIENDASCFVLVKSSNKSNGYTYTKYEFDLGIDFTDTSKKYVSDYILLANNMRTALTEQDVIDKFKKCNLDYSKILPLYNLQ